MGIPVHARADQANYIRISPDVRLGANVAIHCFVNLYGCRIGDDSRVGSFVEIQKNAVIGARCKISSHTFICEGVTIEDRATGKLRQEPASAVFAFIGADARTEWLPPPVIRDERGFVCTGRDVMDLVAARAGDWPLERDPFLLETSVPGVFAAGDIRADATRRVANAVGEGAICVRFVHQYLKEI